MLLLHNESSYIWILHYPINVYLTFVQIVMTIKVACTSWFAISNIEAFLCGYQPWVNKFINWSGAPTEILVIYTPWRRHGIFGFRRSTKVQQWPAFCVLELGPDRSACQVKWKRETFNVFGDVVEKALGILKLIDPEKQTGCKQTCHYIINVIVEVLQIGICIISIGL